MRTLLAVTKPLRVGTSFLQVPRAGGVGSGTLTPDILTIPLAAGGGRDEFIFSGDQSVVLGQPSVVLGSVPLIEVRYGTGVWMTIADFNAALAFVDSSVLLLGYQFTIRMTAADKLAVVVEIIATYNG